MIDQTKAFSSFSVKDLAVAKKFYEEILGLEVTETNMGLEIPLHGSSVFIYEKPNHEPASFTVLNLPVEDIDKVVDDLVAKGVTFERYDSLPAKQDDKGILRGKAAGQGPDIAWFTDPSGNVFSVMD